MLDCQLLLLCSRTSAWVVVDTRRFDDQKSLQRKRERVCVCRPKKTRRHYGQQQQEQWPAMTLCL
jgi:hypothetical protein